MKISSIMTSDLEVLIAELDAFFQKYRIALEVQGAQHRLHSTSWYKDVKKLEDIVNRNRKKRCICQDKGISLLEVWYDEKPEIVIPKRIQKIKEFICLVSKSFNIQSISYKTLTPEYLDWYAKLTQASDFKPITFEARPDPELIIKSVLEHLKFGNSFRGIDNYNFVSAQPWSSPCLASLQAINSNSQLWLRQVV